MLRLEGLAVFALAVFLYARGGHSWLLFVGLFLVPDVGALGYLVSERVGAATYNALHNYVVPLVLAMILFVTGRTFMLPLIWISHIGFDRTLGFGLKYPTNFRDTHLGRIGGGVAS